MGSMRSVAEAALEELAAMSAQTVAAAARSVAAAEQAVQTVAAVEALLVQAQGLAQAAVEQAQVAVAAAHRVQQVERSRSVRGARGAVARAAALASKQTQGRLPRGRCSHSS